MRKFLLLFLLLFPAMMWGIELKYLIVTHDDGTITTFALADRPVVIPQDGELLISCKGETYTLTTSDIKNITFTETEPTGIDDVVTPQNKPLLLAGRVLFSGLKAGALAELYTTGGVLLDRVKADATGAAVIDYSQLPAGIYIARAGKSNIKIAKK